MFQRLRFSIPAFTGIAAIATLCACGSSGGYDVDDIYPDGDPASAEIVSGNDQTAVAGTELPSPIVGKLVDLKGHTAANRGVVFVVTGGGGRVSSEAAFSDSNGLVQTRWTLGPGAGAQKVEIRSGASDSNVAFATFGATATAAAGVTATEVAGTNEQAARKSTALPAPVSVSVVDLHGNAKPGVPVTFTPCATCGSADPATAVTNAGGIASTRWTLGAQDGAQDLSARVSDLRDVRFRATALRDAPAPPSNLVALQGDAQSVEQHGRNAQALRVFVTDSLGNGVPGVAVDFAPAAGSAYFTAQTINTGTDGVADFSAYFHAAGAVRVTAAVAGLPSTSFDLVVDASAFAYDGSYDCRFADTSRAPFELAIAGNEIAHAAITSDGTFVAAGLHGAIDIDAEGGATADGVTGDATSPAAWSCERR